MCRQHLRSRKENCATGTCTRKYYKIHSQVCSRVRYSWVFSLNGHRGGPSENSDIDGLRLRGPQTMAHLLSCHLLDEACTADDLATVTERANMHVPASGRKLCEGHDKRKC